MEQDRLKRPDLLWLEVTGKCNLQCKHCYAESSPYRRINEGMELSDWMGALDEGADLGFRRVQFIGGEPTLHPDLPRMIERARHRGFQDVCVYSNGTHLNSAIKESLLKHQVSLAVSIYGTDGSVHDGVTQRLGSFDKTCRVLQWALDVGLKVRVGVVAMESNLHDAFAAERSLREVGIPVHLDMLRGLGRARKERPDNEPLEELCGRCGDGKLCVSVSGEIFPCIFSRFHSLGHIRAVGLRGALAGETLARFRDALLVRRSTEPSSGTRAHVLSDGGCSPEQDPGPCNPEKDPGPCNPEKDPGPCNPEKDPGPCNPEKDPGPCNPERDGSRDVRWVMAKAGATLSYRRRRHMIPLHFR